MHCPPELPSVLFQMHRPFPPTHPGTGVKVSNDFSPFPRSVSFPLLSTCHAAFSLVLFAPFVFPVVCALLHLFPLPCPLPLVPPAALFGGRRFLETTLAGSGQVPPPPPPYSLGQPSPPLGSVFQRLVPRSAAGPCRLLSSPCGAQPSWAFGPRCFFSRTRPFRHGEGSFSSPRVISTARVHPRPVASVPLIPFAFSPSGALNHRLSSL